ncbi:ABC transporter permease [Lachnoanaerobaculum saburreum]|uniref:ABC transporter, permease protein n=1 Tax=Lachnoanaerobaculum saburreum DSM 3986 TaxID=887325 RepID=E6LQJ3_9FIRM|nr:ABC transporter permease [Lachnoanaerobaculum saburreum]EFU75888.1 ABC transporter, permease protein [Lachnoanaerobaculum saburreum DSM 3986]
MYHSDILKNMAKNKIAILSAMILICLVIICIFAPFLTPYDPNKQALNDRLLAPSMTHLWGTDQYGRDILTRCIYGCRISLSVGIISQLIATFIGYFLGVAAGYFGEIVDDIISFIIQVFSSFPFLLFAMALMYALGAGKVNLYLSLGFLSWAATARLIRSKVMEIKNQEYIQACKIDGGSNLRIILKHLLPNCIPMLIVSITLGIPNAILSEASLSYLGLGIPVPTASWGNMIAESQQFIRSNTYYSLFPGLCIIVTVMAFNMFGDGLRDALDPKLHSQKGGL